MVNQLLPHNAWRAGNHELEYRYRYFERYVKASTALTPHGIIAGLKGQQRVDAGSDDVSGRLIVLVKQVLGSGKPVTDPFPMSTQLSDLGVSSLKMVNLMLAVEVEFDIAIPQSDITPENFESCSSIISLVKRIREK